MRTYCPNIFQVLALVSFPILLSSLYELRKKKILKRIKHVMLKMGSPECEYHETDLTCELRGKVWVPSSYLRSLTWHAISQDHHSALWRWGVENMNFPYMSLYYHSNISYQCLAKMLHLQHECYFAALAVGSKTVHLYHVLLCCPRSCFKHGCAICST